MKSIKINIGLCLILAVAGLATTSCSKDFLERRSTTSLSSGNAFDLIEDIEAATTGMYYPYMGDGSYAGLGRNQVVIPELMTDICQGATQLPQFQNFTFSETDADIGGIYARNYDIADRAARVIQGVTIFLEKDDVSADEIRRARRCLAQAYGVKALQHFFLVNWFALPYSAENTSKPGIILIDEKPYLPNDVFKRSTIGETYALIQKDIDSALSVYGTSNLVTETFFYMNKAAVYALKARVNLYMGNWAEADSAAQMALDISGGSIEMDPTAYKNMWAQNTTASREDIFTTQQDKRLGANSLANFWGTYNCVMSDAQLALYESGDMRRSGGLWRTASTGISITKYTGTADGNTRVFSVPEMYLIQAEARAQQNDLANAKVALFNVAKRNANYTAATDIPPTTKDDLLKFISEERRRELVGEGHRLFDARRTGEKISRTATSGRTYTDWDCAKFVFPIPQTQAQVAKIEQNEGWDAMLP